MPELSRFYGIIIRMYYNDHNPPHFHAEYQGFKAEISIQTLEIINGSLPKRALSLVLEWAVDHRAELLQDWSLAAIPKPLNTIEPLS